MVSRDTFAAECTTIINNPAGVPSFREAAVDSRAVREGDLFIPLAGERTDGHFFIREAFEQGAAGVIVAEKFYRDHRDLREYLQNHPEKIAGIVTDTLGALQRMARREMKEHGKKLFRIGVTGSNGKTTTKELIGAVLSMKGPVFINKGNLNSEIGLCQEVLRFSGAEPCAVFEMGMNRRGEMDILAEIVRPDYGVITNIGTAHIGLIGSVEGIAAEKKKIFSRFSGGETGFIHEDEPFYHFLAEEVRGTVLPYGKRSAGKRIIEQDKGLAGSEIIFPEGTIRFPLVGGFNRRNMYAAYVIGRLLGVSFAGIKEALESARPLFGRGQIIEGEITVILDCYNANYDSMREALSLLAGIGREGKKTAIVGDMAELGAHSREFHADLGRYAALLDLDCIYFYGPGMRAAYDAALGVPGGKPRFLHTEDIDVLAREAEEMLFPGDLLLLKGSRSIELERVLHYLRKKEKSLC